MARGPQPPLATSVTAPFGTKRTLASQRQEFYDETYRCGPFHTWDWMEDFDGSVPFEDYYIPVVSAVATIGTNVLPAANTNTALGTFVVPRDGVITAAGLTTITGQAANDTNFFTFTMLNKLAAGSGSTAILAATPVNTTLATGGAAITANVEYPLTLNATAANLRVAAGDVLQFTSTTTQTPTLQNNPILRIRIAFPSRGIKTLINRTAGSPLVQRVAAINRTSAVGQLSATNEVNDVVYYLGDQLTVDPTKAPLFTAIIKTDAITTAQALVIGLASAYNTTLSSMTYNAWFRLAASMAVTIEGDDNTTDTDGQAASPALTLTADTYYRFQIDFSNLAAVEFRVDGNLVGTVALSALSATTLLQPMVALKKASGAGTVGVTIDNMRVRHQRF